jgi:hypothetical protein
MMRSSLKKVKSVSLNKAINYYCLNLKALKNLMSIKISNINKNN